MRLVIFQTMATPIGGRMSPRDCRVVFTATRHGSAIGSLLNVDATTAGAKEEGFVVTSHLTNLTIRAPQPLSNPGRFFASVKQLILKADMHSGRDDGLTLVDGHALQNTSDLLAVAPKLCLVLRNDDSLRSWIVRVDGWEGQISAVLNMPAVEAALRKSPFRQDFTARGSELWVQAPQPGSKEQIGGRLALLIMPYLRVPPVGRGRRSFRIEQR